MKHQIIRIVKAVATTSFVCLLILALSGPVQPVRSSQAPAQALAPPAQDGASAGFAGPFGFGRAATNEEIAAWDIDVRPDGAGLPDGSGTVAEGAVIYAEQCARCHGETGVEGPYDPLVALYDADNWPGDVRAIGNYWPYATTVYDYTYRSMPYDSPKSLTPDQVYAVTAWMLHQNGIIEEDAVMNAETLPQVEMPALEKWVPRDLRETYPFR